jgi:hypothetical protein
LYQAPIKDGRPDSNVHRCKDDEDEEVPVATEEPEAKRRRVAGGKKATKRATKRKATKRKTHNKRKTAKLAKRGKK